VTGVRRPGGMSRLLRPLLAVIAAMAFTAVPLVSVHACSCMELPFEQAVQDADLAIVGTLTRVDADGVPGDLQQPIAMHWSIERSRDALEVSQATIGGWRDDGANCGVAMEVGQRWLVLASLGENGLETNGCMQNRLLDADDPDSAAIVESMVPVASTPEPAAATAAPPLPIIVAGAAVLLVAALSYLAFRRRAARDA
jgi:hypothetical protein